MKRHIVIFIILAAALVLGCNNTVEEKFHSANSEVSSAVVFDEAAKSEAMPTAPPPAREAPAMRGGAAEGGGGEAGGDIPSVAAFGASESAEMADKKLGIKGSGASADPMAAEPPAVAQNLPMAGQLTAGAWSDNANWDFWTGLMGKGYEQHLREWNFDLTNRFVVAVKHSGNPARNVPVVLMDAQGNKIWSAMSDGKGNAYLFAPRMATAPFDVRVAGLPATRALPAQTLAVDLSQQPAPKVADSIEVMFVVDTTGSMGDELAYVQSELADVAAQVRERTRNEFELRVGTAVYRDHHEEYLVRTGPFTTNVQDSVAFLSKQSAGGGGDFPEAVDEALEEVIDKTQWSAAARARLLFLVLDAPPHQDQEGKERLRKAMANAARQGIQVIPVVGSGIDKNTEFVMRTMAILTQGTYVFLTSHSGIGGAHIEPTTGDYEVEKLNALIVRLIAEASS